MDAGDGGQFCGGKAALSKATWLGHRDIPLGSLLVSFHVIYRPLKPSGVRLTWNCLHVLKGFGISGSSSRSGPSPTTLITRRWSLGALARVSDPRTARQCRHLAYIAEFTSDIQHVAGQDNVATDAMSWPPVTSSSSPSPCAAVVADLRGIAARQQSCPSMQQASYSPSLQVSTCEVEGVRLLGDTSTGRMRPLVPHEDRWVVFQAIHNVAHPGIRATRSAHFVWQKMNSDIASWCKDCVACQRAKVTRQPQSSLQPIPIPQRRFSHVHVDLVGPLPVSGEGWTYHMTMVDRTTRWVEEVPSRGSLQSPV
jgi:hypothetical protein